MRLNIGRVEANIYRMIRERGALHFSLIDPDKTSPREAGEISKELSKAGTAAFLIGGSTGVSERELDEIILAVKENVENPVILFPGNVSGISREADAILFMSLLNSDDPYFITGAQVLGSIIVKKYGLEPIPTAYIIVGEGGVAGYIGKARPIPEDKHELIASYVLAASMLGMRFAYLEKGSGASKPLSPECVVKVKRISPSTHIIVGGGVRRGSQAEKLVGAGADIIVTGTIIEESLDVVKDVIEAVANAGYEKVSKSKR